MALTLSANPRSGAEQGVPPLSMVERVTLIMDSFERPHTRLTLHDVAHQTGLPRSTTHRILDQLVRLGWLDHTANGYGLGPRALGLGGREIEHGALRAAAAPRLHEIALQTGMVVHLAVLDGAEIYYLDKVGGRAAVDIPSRVGGRAAAHCTALGKALLAWLPPEGVDARYASVLDRCTARSIGDLDMLHQELGRIRRRNGLAFEHGECFPDIGCVAVALRGPEGPIGAISIVGHAHSVQERVAPLVVNAARAVTNDLFSASAPTHHVYRGPATSQQLAGVTTWSREPADRFRALGPREDLP